MAEAAILFLKNCQYWPRFIFLGWSHTDKILNESRRRLEVWSNDVLGNTIHLLVVYCTFVALF